MKKITTAELKNEVDLDPAWASHLTEPWEVVDYCDLAWSRITHLSPFLHFVGKDTDGNCANFQATRITIAEGTFAGHVTFAAASIEKIGKLHVLGCNHKGQAASFWRCPNLKVAEGIFPGFVDFSHSKVDRTEKLTITHGDSTGWKADFTGCHKIRLPKEFLGNQYQMEPYIRRENLQRIAASNAQKIQPELEI